MDYSLIDGMLDQILPHLKTLQDRCEALQARVEMLEARTPEKGDPGKDADPEAVRAMAEEIVERWLELLPKQPVSHLIDDKGNLVAIFADGEKRELGRVRGASVMDGKVDADGVLVLRMTDGRELQTGTVRGSDGQPGANGEAGRPGRDAMEIRILPGIDETRTYPEGVVARWRGGLIRSERATLPIVDDDIHAAGWGVILNGIVAQADEFFDSGRFVETSVSYTDGSVTRQRRKTVNTIYRELWKAGDYLQGDQVTWKGSMWIALQDTDQVPGDRQDGHWRLATKRGHDGKDLKEPKPRGPFKVPGAASK